MADADEEPTPRATSRSPRSTSSTTRTAGGLRRAPEQVQGPDPPQDVLHRREGPGHQVEVAMCGTWLHRVGLHVREHDHARGRQLHEGFLARRSPRPSTGTPGTRS
ncbi:hypothetical protein HBB16_07815 [Pseudonocardia sp. MCCB 268]|nr:hypothetical protein [Pseudonocardia cytotoxica]